MEGGGLYNIADQEVRKTVEELKSNFGLYLLYDSGLPGEKAFTGELAAKVWNGSFTSNTGTALNWMRTVSETPYDFNLSDTVWNYDFIYIDFRERIGSDKQCWTHNIQPFFGRSFLLSDMMWTLDATHWYLRGRKYALQITLINNGKGISIRVIGSSSLPGGSLSDAENAFCIDKVYGIKFPFYK